MAFSTTNLIDVGPRGSEQRRAAELANALNAYAMNRILSTPTLTIGGTAQKVRTTATCAFTIGGQFQTAVASTDDVWTFGGTNSATVVAASSWQKYALLWDATGASGVAVYEGRQSTISAAKVAWDNISAVGPYSPFFTMLGSTALTSVVVGVLTVATNSSHTFTPGTTGFDGTGITTTYGQGLDPSLIPLIGGPTGLLLGNGG